MECPHLDDNIIINSEVLTHTFSTTKDLKCSECSTKDQVWICLQCGIVNCGRYMNAHAKSHATDSGHLLCMSCEIFSVFCYQCEEYAVNDTNDNRIDKIRQFLFKVRNIEDHDILGPDIGNIPEIEGASMGKSESRPPSPSLCEDTLHAHNRTTPPAHVNAAGTFKNSPRRRSPNDVSSRNFSAVSVTITRVSENNESDSESWNTGLKAPEDSGRSLRPRSRKRSHSEDSSSTENSSASSTGSGAAGKRPTPHSPTPNGKTDRHRDKKVVGLRNLGNTCFMNAVLQSLSNIQEFSCYFNALPSLEGKTNGRRVYHSRSYKEVQDVVMAEELRKVLINLSAGGCGSKSAISPECLFLVIWKVVPRFRGYQQQDAHEFLRYMLDRLHTELLQLLPSDVSLKDGGYFSLAQRGRSSIVTTVFGGTLQSEVRCLACGTDSKKHDPFLDLSLDIPERLSGSGTVGVCGGGGRRTSGAANSGVGTGNASTTAAVPEEGNCSPTPVCSIDDCLTSFVEVEELADTELYLCGSCKSKQRSTKQFWIRRLPNVLCLHIKRFRWNNFFRTKIDTNISFPITALDMSQFVLSNLPETRRSGAGNNLYDLAAVIVHHGSGAGSGHYTAFAINDGQWFHFNDSSVRPTDVGTVASCKPYILFYIRREFSLPNHLAQ